MEALLASAQKEAEQSSFAWQLGAPRPRQASGEDLGSMNDGTVVNTFLVLMKLDPDKADALRMLGFPCLRNAQCRC